MTAPDPSRLELVALARLSTAAKKPPGPADVRKTLAALTGTGGAEADRALDRLEERGEITRSPLRLTDAGRARLRDELGVSGRASWRILKSTLFPALGLGIDPADRKLVRRLGRADELRKLATARLTGARGTDADAVRTALAKSWLAGEPLVAGGAQRASARSRPETTAPQGQSAPASSSRSPAGAREGDGAPLSLERFAELARTHAAAVGGDGRFGERKVFIAAAWERAQRDPHLASLDFEQFKAWLLQAHRRGLLTLHRADLVPAMDSGKVEASEIRYLNATFHFVEPEAPSRA